MTTNPAAPFDSITAVIAIGGNLPGDYGSTRALLKAAVARLPAFGVAPLARSRWWRSAAWPDPSEPEFLNAVVLARPSEGPRETLAALHRLEAAFGRRRGVRNAPRTLDLDLIAWADERVEEGDLLLPHPRARERLFVMGPLAEIAPGWRWPGSGESAEALAARASVGADATPD